jgi:hypothetical protein
VGIVVKIALIALGLVLLAGMVARLFRKNKGPVDTGPKMQRMPLIVPLVGWGLLLTGVALGAGGFNARPGIDPTGMRIGSAAALVLGLLVMIMYRNRYVRVGADRVLFRTALGRQGAIAYRDVVESKVTDAGRLSNVQVQAKDGTRMRVNSAVFDVAPLLAAIQPHPSQT